MLLNVSKTQELHISEFMLSRIGTYLKIYEQYTAKKIEEEVVALDVTSGNRRVIREVLGVCSEVHDHDKYPVLCSKAAALVTKTYKICLHALKPTAATYDIVLLPHCLSLLNNEESQEFMTRILNSLKACGSILIFEELSSSDTQIETADFYRCIRPMKWYQHLFNEVGLDVSMEESKRIRTGEAEEE